MDYMSIDMQGYDAVVAVTENNINKNFKDIFGDEDGIRRNINLEIKKSMSATLVGVIRPPRVRLRVDGDPRKVLFIIDIKRAGFTYWDHHFENVARNYNDVSGTIGLVANLRLDDLDTRVHPVPKEVRDRIKDPNFSVRQLFMDFQTADIATWDPKESSIMNSMNNLGQEVFPMVINDYLGQLRESGHLILGYAVTTKNPNTTHFRAPSISPTDLNFYVNSYKPPTGAKYEHGLDTLCYLMMTEKRQMPSETPSWFGNWAQDLGEYGKAGISKANFFDRFLLPHLAGTANIHTTIVDRGNWTVTIDSGAGGKDYNPTADGGEYKGPTELVFRNENTDMTWSAVHTSKVSAAAGGSKIEIKGSSEIYMKSERWIGIKYHAISASLKLGMHVEWSTTISLTSVERGELEVTVSPLKVEERVLDEAGWGAALERNFSPNFAQQCAHLLRELSGIAKRAVDVPRLQRGITEALNGMNSFIFPGGGDFKMFNPRFNEHRDLIVDLQWEAVTAPPPVLE
jgi:hypothetical protein